MITDGQNHEILKPAISGFYIRFHPVYMTVTWQEEPLSERQTI
jgi:hypothetical protein